MVEDSTESLVIVARAVRTRGLKGEIVAQLLSDFPERFEKVGELIAVSQAGERRVVELESHWLQKDRVILKLVGIDSVEGAAEFVGFDFAVPEVDRFPLPVDHYYDWELEGCTVRTVDRIDIGTVRQVLRTGGVEILGIVDDSGKESLVPMVATIVRNIDAVNKSIVIDPPDGLLDL